MPERVSPQKGMSDETFEHHMKRYEFALPYVKDAVVLSVACGNGYGEHLFATEGAARQVYGLDVSDEAVQYAKDNYHEENLEYRVGDGLAIDFPDAFFDVVVSFETVEHIEDDKGFLKELRRVLKPGGTLIISTPNRAKSLRNYIGRKPANPYHVREYLHSEFDTLLREDFSLRTHYGQKTIFKRRLHTLPAYFYAKYTGRLALLEKRHYVVEPYPTQPDRETAVFVAVCQ